ncbi:MAG: phosphatase PAP2 family protein [Clostridia bacterium]|nr:phosphatase PAP2 family protein [Clostridia bacterium]
MSFLVLLESIRTPVFTAIMSAVTWLGHELLPIAIICIFYWCLSKKLAYKAGFSFFFSGLTVQTLKITFRIDRPWILDPDFKPVESAIEEATGYSFPSGHTQAATSLFGTLALYFKKWYVKLVCVLLFLLVGFSRMYLGVHTPLDVLVSMGVTLFFSVAVFIAIDKIYDTRKYDAVLSSIMALISLAVMIYAAILMNNGTIEYKYASDCCKSGGAGLAFAIGFFLERKYINFDVKAKNAGIQIVKFIVGIAVALAAKSALKPVLALFLTDGVPALIGDSLRYFVLVIWIIAVYPAIFKKLNKSGR